MCTYKPFFFFTNKLHKLDGEQFSVLTLNYA